MDPSRIPLFEALYDELSSRYFPDISDENKSEEAFRMFSFFESYFSNYIEGTEFEIGEAKQIIDTGISLPMRIEDSHDILGTFKILSNRQEMHRIPETENEFLALLRHRHSVLLEWRPNCNPGQFKVRRNRAGNIEFFAPELVEGTLKYGFRLYRNLREPFAKAVFMMFLCSEVHPFTDGNGRVSRVMMNADPLPFIAGMEKLQRFSSNLWGEDFYEPDHYLRSCNAYEKPEAAKLRFIDRIGIKS